MPSYNLLKISLLIAITMTLNIASATESEHSHKHESGHDEKLINIPPLTLDQGNKWPIDESLHIGMTRIKTSMEKNINDIHYKTFKSKQYQTLSIEIQNHLSYLFAHCKLPKNADEQLHSLLFSIMQGSEKMNITENKREGAIAIIKAVQKYPEYFQDEKWQPLQH